MLAILGTTAMPAAASQPTDPVAIIVHPDLDLDSISKSELSKIFLGRLRTWHTNGPASPVDQVPDSEMRSEFSRLVHGRSVVNIEVYWKRMIFSGRGVPPPELRNDQEVLQYVRTTPGAVGYVGEASDLEGVHRVVLDE